MSRARVLLADDHRMVAEGLKTLLSPEFDLVDVVEDGQALVEAARRLRPDVIVADIGMPRLNGFEALAQLRKDDPGVRVVFLTMHQEAAYARRALESGALGFVLKHSAPAELVTAIRAALDGGVYVSPALAGELRRTPTRAPGSVAETGGALSARQREIVQLLAEGCSAKEIARRLDISHRTVEFHKYQMMDVLGLRSTAQLVRWAIKQGLVTP
ncbi:MAG: response regulator transcription factor [Gammaproteobacteria bacterium]|nr:response regulator transcription factor [Gammaproteobacteria bacterium]